MHCIAQLQLNLFFFRLKVEFPLRNQFLDRSINQFFDHFFQFDCGRLLNEDSANNFVVTKIHKNSYQKYFRPERIVHLKIIKILINQLYVCHQRIIRNAKHTLLMLLCRNTKCQLNNFFQCFNSLRTYCLNTVCFIVRTTQIPR